MISSRSYTITTLNSAPEDVREAMRRHISRITGSDLKRENPSPAKWDKAREWMDTARVLIHSKIVWDEGTVRDFLRYDMPIPNSGSDWLDQLCMYLVMSIINHKAARDFAEVLKADAIASAETSATPDAVPVKGETGRYHRGKKRHKQKSRRIKHHKLH